MNNYPEGQAEHAEGVYDWSTSANDTMKVGGAQLLVNQVLYGGIATLRRKADGQFDVMFGDIYFHRLNGGHKEPTRAACKVFQQRVVEIAQSVDTDELRYGTRVAVLHEELDNSASAVINLKEEIEEHEDRIREFELELAGLE